MTVIILAVIGIIAIAVIGYFWITGKYIDKAKVVKKKDETRHLD